MSKDDDGNAWKPKNVGAQENEKEDSDQVKND